MHSEPFVQLNAADTFVNSAGLSVKGGVQTSRISNQRLDREDVEIEAVSQSLNLQAGTNLSLTSQFGNVKVEAFDTVTIEAGSTITLDASAVYVQNLDTSSNSAQYNLCVCASGKLYQVPGNAQCSSGSTTCP